MSKQIIWTACVFMILLAAEELFFTFVLDPVLKDSNTMQRPLQTNVLAGPATASWHAEEGAPRAIPMTHTWEHWRDFCCSYGLPLTNMSLYHKVYDCAYYPVYRKRGRKKAPTAFVKVIIPTPISISHFSPYCLHPSPSLLSSHFLPPLQSPSKIKVIIDHEFPQCFCFDIGWEPAGMC